MVEHEHLGGENHLLVLDSPLITRDARPGNFVLAGVGCSGEETGSDPLLPRPFSLLSASPEDGKVEIYFKVVGKGTALMAALSRGDRLRLVGPLGNQWPQPEGDLLLVTGGVGVPPISFLAEAIAAGGPRERGQAVLFYGGRTMGDIQLVERFEESGVEVHLATEDGSAGEKGTCVDALSRWLDARPPQVGTTVFACGPTGMLSATARLAEKRGLPAYVSVEAPMACGIGVCRGCAVEMRDGSYRMACDDGPVFLAEEVSFE